MLFLKLLLTIATLFTNVGCTTSPLEKITITSQNAIYEKKDLFSTITYNKNVKTTLADGTIITSDTLYITFSTPTQNKADSINLQTIIFAGKVFITQKNRTINTDLAKIYPEKKRCKLDGNVKVEQIKDKSNTVPIITRSNSATLDLNTDKMAFIGTPVSTTINLEGHPILEKIKPRKKHEYHKNTT